MNTHVEKDLERVYLILDGAKLQTEEYSLQMLLHCSVPSLLPLDVVSRDGGSLLRADVTACTNLTARYRSKALSGEDIRRILHAIRDLALQLPKYLLDPRDLYLVPDAVYLGAGHDEILLCYVPHLAEEDPHTIRALNEFFLKKADHSDAVAVQLSYGLFDRISVDQYVLLDVISGLLDNTRDGSAVSQQSVPSAERTPTERAPTEISARWDAEDTRGRGGSPAAGQNSPSPGTHLRGRQTFGPQLHSRQTFDTQSRDHITFRKNHSSRTASSGKGASHFRRLLPALIIISCAVAVTILFHLDPTQVGGMAFLCAALIWMISSALEKRRSDIKNVWADEEDPGDDAFYQSLLREVYADDPSASFEPAASFDPSASFDSAASSRSDARAPGPGIFTSEPLREAAAPRLLSLQPDTCPSLTLSTGHLILGKSRRSADAILPDPSVSRSHARVERRMDGYYVTDLYSTNGTLLNGQRLEPGQAMRLKDGDLLCIAALRYQVCLPSDSAISQENT